MSIYDIGGSGSKKSVLDNINGKGYIEFNDLDLEVKKNRNELHWRNDLAFIRKKLVVEGYINDSEKNNWKITESGKTYLINLCEEIINTNFTELKKLSNFAVKSAKAYLESLKSNKPQKLQSDKKVYISVSETEKEQLIKIRIGQGTFKKKLISDSNKCKICGLSNQSLLIASHIKPWKDSDNNERLDVNNGFLLCPIHDSLFDKGYITFDNEGKILISDKLEVSEYNLLSISTQIMIRINDENKRYLKWHRENIFDK